MANEIFHVGCKIEMRAENKPNMPEGVPEVYISQFVQWESDDVLSIVVPTYKGHFLPLMIDEIYELIFWQEQDYIVVVEKLSAEEKSAILQQRL